MKRVFRSILCLAATLSTALPASAAIEQVVEDAPGSLVFDVAVPGFSLETAPGADGVRVTCGDCASSDRPGAPDLPSHRFAVLTGEGDPSISITVLESETRVVSAGIRPVPRYLSPTRLEYARDAAAYSEAGAPAGRLLSRYRLRRAPVRGVEVPLATWNESARALTLIKRIRIRMSFPGVLNRPASPLEPAVRREVRNPVGGLWLFSDGRSAAGAGRALGKTANAKSRSAAAPVEVAVDTLIRIKVRSKSVESFAEDRFYAFAYSSLPKDIAEYLRASSRKLSWMRMLTGINDSLPFRVDTAAPVPGRLHEIPMQVVDSLGDGIFGPGDTLKFFAHGTNFWKRVENPATSIRYEFSNDPYSLDNYYYLDFGVKDIDGMRLTAEATEPPTGTPITSSRYYIRAERDVETAFCDHNAIKDQEGGPDWHWKWRGDCSSSPELEMTGTELTTEATSSLPDVAGDTILMGLYTYPADSRFQVIFGGAELGEFPDSVSPGNWFFRTGKLTGPAFVPDKVVLKGGARRFEGYTLIYRRTHSLASGAAWIFPEETGKRVSYRVEGGAGAFCLRIVDGEARRMVRLDAGGTFTDSLAPGANARYHIFRAPQPIGSGAVEFEVLPSGLSSKGPIRNLATCDSLPPEKLPDYLIVTGRSLVRQALKLRDYRDSAGRVVRTRPAVVTVEDIYRQYSGGRLSPAAIRDFLRYAYAGWNRGSAAEGILRYVVLFGDGHFDYRNLSTSAGSGTSNIVPPFELMPEMEGWSDGTEQLASDDFYGSFAEGPLVLASQYLSVAIGRVPVQTEAAAEDYLEKIRNYEDPRKAGEWRARVVLAADDNLQRGSRRGNNLDDIGRGHTSDTDSLGKIITGNQKGTILDKIYLLDYPLNSAFHKPQAAQDLLALINRGAVAVNYVGHGASNQWADEVLLQTNDAVARMRNEGRTGMVNAFSCTVGRFESLGSEGMSEQFVKQKSVGAIGAVSATRESFPGPNLELAREFYRRTFPPDDSGGYMTVGEALQFAKNGPYTGSGTNDLKYCLLGEPVLLMRKAQLKVSLTETMDTIRALGCGFIRGRVEGGTGSGKVSVKVIAGTVHKVYTNLGQDMVDQVADKRGSILFEGTVPYRNGEFSAEYFIPKQISYGDSTARVTAFAWDSLEEREGTAARENLWIRGTSTQGCNVDTDGKGPAIRISGCEVKETGGLDFPDRVRLSVPYCLQIDVSDSTGGVMSAEGPDEGTTLEIPGVLDPFHPQPGIDDLVHKTYQLTLDPGRIRPGSHLLKVSARDGYGNYSARRLQMDITYDSSLVAIWTHNHPNPMKRSGTTFYFGTGMPSMELEYGGEQGGMERLYYEVRIYNQAGKLVRVLKNAVSGTAKWDGRDQWGNTLGNGVYFYKVVANQVAFAYDDQPGYSTTASKYNTLVISR